MSLQDNLTNFTVGTERVFWTDRKFYLVVGKRVFDVLSALALMLMFAPFMMVIWVILMVSGGTPFFGHMRVGRSGRPFRCWKFRTMAVNAEELLVDLLARNPEAARQWADSQKLMYDPRVTRVGLVLRQTSLDELPQLWNVLVGDMSLVGPRPVTEDELVRYGDAVAEYQSVRPGLTGPWQVSGRDRVGYSERVELDQAYVEQLNFWYDIKIAFRTIGAVIGRTGH